MYSILTIIVFIIGIFILWIFWSTIDNKNLTMDDFLVQNYPNKLSYKQRLVLVIESYNTIEDLLTLIRNILNQNMKVDSLMLISSNNNLNKIKLVKDTCILHKIGGLSFLLKESSKNTIILFLFSECFNAFSDPYFLNKFLTTNDKINGIVRAETNLVNVELNKVYHTL
jgi:hypothetical protein